jgi:hypothetical protein
MGSHTMQSLLQVLKAGAGPNAALLQQTVYAYLVVEFDRPGPTGKAPVGVVFSSQYVAVRLAVLCDPLMDMPVARLLQAHARVFTATTERN